MSQHDQIAFIEGRSPYSLGPAEKRAFLLGALRWMQQYHADRCAPYARFIENSNGRPRGELGSVDELPFLPVTVFKDFELKSSAGGAMELNSSATTSGKSSKVFADKATRKRQSLSANQIWIDFLGAKRRPYLVFDDQSTVRGSSAMSARGAAIMSLAHLSSSFYFVMKQEGGQLRLDANAFRQALEAIGDQPFLAYGFTYVLHQAHEELRRAGLPAGPAHPESVLLHSGGWKRLEAIAVDKATFNQKIADVWRLAPQSIIDFYGVVEQVGVPYPDCCEGIKHAPYWAEVVIRRSDTLQPVEEGETGLIQLVNCLPLSGPNHSVLTEDLGELVVHDGCRCGRRGRAFRFQGRAPRSEVRGCSDVGRH